MKKITTFIYLFGFRLRNKLIRVSMHILRLRPASYPYITGDGFRKIANHIYDETGKCNPQDIQDGEIVFLKSDMIPEWFEKIHPKITQKYKLISHNSDYNVTDYDLLFIDNKIIHWFAQNVLTTHSHPKLTPIPIGINNYYIYMQSAPRFYDTFRKIICEQKNRIIFGFSIDTNPKERQPAYNFLINLKTADRIKGKNYPRMYVKLIKRYKFIAAPNGNGLDDPRRWQALYFGIIPIVTKSIAMDYFKSIGLPIYIIQDWRELEKLEEKDLSDIYVKMMSSKNDAPLFFDYWRKIITP